MTLRILLDIPKGIEDRVFETEDAVTDVAHDEPDAMSTGYRVLLPIIEIKLSDRTQSF